MLESEPKKNARNPRRRGKFGEQLRDIGTPGGENHIYW